MNVGEDKLRPDLVLRLPSREVVVSIRELDQRQRRIRPLLPRWTTTQENSARPRTNTSSPRADSRSRQPKAWNDRPVLTLSDSDQSTLEEQLPTLIWKLEVAEAEAGWQREEESRRAEIREVRWEEVKQRALSAVTAQQQAQLLGVGTRGRHDTEAVVADDQRAEFRKIADHGSVCPWCQPLRRKR